MKVLILTTDQELALLRQRVLESAGHDVAVTITEKQAFEAAEKQVPFDVALLCHRLPDATARKLIRVFREGKRPGNWFTFRTSTENGLRWRRIATWSAKTGLMP